MTILFWCLAILLIAAVLYPLLKPLLSLKQLQSREISRENTLAGIYAERRRQLESQHQRGELDDEQFQIACAELEVSLAEELPEAGEAAISSGGDKSRKILLGVLGIGVPLLAVLLYFQLGTPAAIKGPPQAGAVPGGMPGIEEMIARLEQRLQSQPEDVEGWIMLGRSHAAMNELEKARDAYMQAAKRAPANPELLLSIAEVTAALQGNSLIGEPETFIALALQLDPQSQHGRFLKALLQYQQDDVVGAIAGLRQLLGETSEPREQEVLNAFIAQIEGRPAAVEEPAPAPPATVETGEPQINVSVRLSEALAAKVSPNDTLFIYARITSGPPMPLAIVRASVSELPINVILSDAQAMMPQMKLSMFEQVDVIARISRTGNAQASSGDLQGISTALNPKQNPGVEILIDSIVP